MDKYQWLQEVARNRKIPAAGKSVAILLALKYQNSKTGRCFPSIKTLSSDTGMSRVSVIKGLKIMKSEGLIIVERKGRQNHYKFSISQPILTGKDGLTGKGNDTIPVNKGLPYQSTHIDTNPVLNPVNNSLNKSSPIIPIDGKSGKKKDKFGSWIISAQAAQRIASREKHIIQGRQG